MSERSIFLQALELGDPTERSAFLATACGTDVALRQRLELLLKSHTEAGSFLGIPVLEQSPPPSPTPEDATETHHATDVQDASQASIDFLAPSQRPGSLGRLGHYEVLEVVGRGGMGVVLRAFDEKLHRVVAVKVMARELASHGNSRKRFLREAAAAAAVTNDHVVAIHAIHEEGTLPYLVMQFIEGLSLQQKIAQEGSLELKEILRIGSQIAAGLVAAHKQGLVHRDIKPANILLENGVQRVKITDFGLARAVDDASVTRSGVIAGTPQFMSPEQADGKALDHRSDLFSLGSVLYAMCTGRAPFRAETTMATLRRVCDDTPRPIRELNPDIPEWLCEIIAKLHAKNPAERYQTAKEVAGILEEWLAQVQAGTATSVPGVVSPAVPAPAVASPVASTLGDSTVALAPAPTTLANAALLLLTLALVSVCVGLVFPAATELVQYGGLWLAGVLCFAGVVVQIVAWSTPSLRAKQGSRFVHPAAFWLGFPGVVGGVFSAILEAKGTPQAGWYALLGIILGALTVLYVLALWLVSRAPASTDQRSATSPAAAPALRHVPARHALKLAFGALAVLLVLQIIWLAGSLWDEPNDTSWLTRLIRIGLFVPVVIGAVFIARQWLRARSHSSSGEAGAPKRGKARLLGFSVLILFGLVGIVIWGNAFDKGKRLFYHELDVQLPETAMVVEFWETKDTEEHGTRMSFSGAWPMEPRATITNRKEKRIKLAPGNYWMFVTKDGKRIEQRLLKIGWGGMQVVRVGSRHGTAMAVNDPKTDGDWTQLFNGKDLTGWQSSAEGWTVSQGTLVAEGRKNPVLRTEGQGYKNFTLRFEHWMEPSVRPTACLEVYLHGLPPENQGKEPQQVLTQWHADGTGTHGLVGPNGQIRAGFTEKFRDAAFKPRQWNKAEIHSLDGQMTIFANGQRVATFAAPDVNTGPIVLAARQADWKLRKIEIRDLHSAPHEVPKRAADVLPFLAGTWKVEAQDLDPKVAAGAAPTTEYVTHEYVANGKFLRGRLGHGVVLHSFDADKNVLRHWAAWSDGSAYGPVVGEFNPDSHSMVWRHRLDNGIESSHLVEFVDGNTVKSRFFHRDANDKLVSDIRVTFVRVKGPVPLPSPDLAADPKRLAGTKVLDRLVGEWRNEIHVKTAAIPIQERTEFARVKAQPILRGYFVEVFETSEKNNTDDYSLIWFDAAWKQYRQWTLLGSGMSFELTGTWDEAATTLTWQQANRIREGRWVFKSDDVREFQHIGRGAGGNTVFEASGVSRRIKPGSAVGSSSAPLVKLRSFTPGKDKLPMPLRPSLGAVTVDGDAWRIENKDNSGNFNVMLAQIVENIPKDGVLVFRARVRLEAKDKACGGDLGFGGPNHLFQNWDQWPRVLASYDGSATAWTEKEARHPVAECFKSDPPAIYLYAGLHAKGVLWIKDVELLNQPFEVSPDRLQKK